MNKDITIKISPKLLQTVIWALGEHAYLAENRLNRMKSHPQDFVISTMTIKEQKENQEEYVNSLLAFRKKLIKEQKRLKMEETS